MNEKNIHFTPKQSNPGNQILAGSVDHFAKKFEGETDIISQEMVGPTILNPDKIQELDNALNIAGFMPSDLQYADQDALQSLFAELNSATESTIKKEILKSIVVLVNAGL
jgi:hypothetical protein